MEATNELRQVVVVQQQQHQQPYAALQSLRDSGDPRHLFLRTVLELTSSVSSSSPAGSPYSGEEEMLLFHAVTGMRSVVLMSFELYGSALVALIRDVMLDLGLSSSCVSSSRPLPRTVRMACLSTAAAFWKRIWDQEEDPSSLSSLSTKPSQLDPAQGQALLALVSQRQAPLISTRAQLFSHLEHLLMEPFQQQTVTNNVCERATHAAHFLSILLGEVAGTSSSGAISYHLSLEFHRRIHAAFESLGDLNQTLRLSMSALGGVVHTLTNNHAAATPTGTADATTASIHSVACAIVSLTMDVLSWEFGHGGRWDTSKSVSSFATGTTLLRPPVTWRDHLIQPDFLGAIFRVYMVVRVSFGELSHKLRQLLLQLSSVTGDIFTSQDERAAYAKFLADGALSVLSSLASESTTTTDDGNDDGRHSETVDMLSMVQCLVANFKISLLSRLPNFGNLLQALASVGDSLLRQNVADCTKLQGDVESMDEKEWRDEAVGIILGATVLLGDDPWLLGSGEGPMAARSALSTTLAPLYSSYVTARVQMAKMEEHYITLHQADLDEVREEISATDLEEEMSSASSLGRVNVHSALVCLGGLLQQCLSSLKLLFESVGTNGTTQEVTPDVAALLEEARLLLLCVCHLLTDDNAGETPMIPEAIVRASSVSESPSAYETCHAITSLVSSLMSLAEFQASKVTQFPADPRLSPLLAKTLLWFFHRWAPAYVLPSTVEYNASGSGENGVLSIWNSGESSQQAVALCISLCLHYHCSWPQEKQVQEEAASLLLALSKRGKPMRSVLVQTPSFCQLVSLHAITAGIRHNAAQLEVETAIAAFPGLQGSPTPPTNMIMGYVRLPYDDRSRVMTALLVGCSEMDDERASGMLSACLTSVHASFQSLIHALSNKQVRSHEINAQEMACLCVEMYCGAARASEMSEPERIPQFMTPSLPHLSGLMVYYAQDLTICERLLRLFRDYAEQFIAMLNREQCLALFTASVDLLKSYSAHHCASRVIHRTSTSTHADLEEEQNYSDVLCAIELLIHLGTKDFIDICGSKPGAENVGVDSNQVTDVLLFGLQQILPLMTQGLLQFPTLCTQYFSLVGFVMDTYPEKVCIVPFELFNSLLESLLFGMSHPDTFISKSSLRGISGLVKEHLQSQVLSNHLAQYPDIIDNCSRRLLNEVVFQKIVWDRLEPAGAALLPLAAVDVNKFVAVVNSLAQNLGSQEKQQRLQSAFQILMKPEVITKVAAGGYEGRMNRLRFKKDFEVFVRDVHSFIVIQ